MSGLLGLLLAAPLAVAPALHDRAALGEPLSLEGFSGHLDVPSAFTHGAGAAHLLATNQDDPRFRGRTTRTWVLSAGLLPWLEGAGRVTEVGARPGAPRPRVIRDLSFNAKLRLPLELLWPGLPFALAAGAQDVGGAAPNFRSRYAVASARWRWLTLSGGVGTGPDRMEGPFAGLTVSPVRFLDLVADRVDGETNLGARLRLPLALMGVPVELGAIAKTTARESAVWELAGTLAVPLALSKWEEEVPTRTATWTRTGTGTGTGTGTETGTEAEARTETGTETRTRTGTGTEIGTGTGTPARAPAALQPSDLEPTLASLGLSGVRAAREGDLCLLEVENERFVHGDADALGVALGTLAALAPEGCARFQLVLSRQRLPLASLEGPLPALRDWFLSPAPRGDLPAALRFRFHPSRPAPLAARRPRDPGALRPALSVAPGVTSFFATEVGLLDALVSVKPEATLQLWPGAQLAARADLPVYRSRNLRSGFAFQDYDHGPRLEAALLEQALPLAPGVLARASAGVVRAHAAGLLGELVFTPGGGSHALGIQGAALRTHDLLPAAGSVDPAPDGPAAIGFWRWSGPAGLQGVLRAGRFFSGDEGWSVDLGRFFGDTQVGVFYADTRVAILGASLSLPLGPRREPRLGPVQVGGSRRFGHEVFTVVRQSANLLTPGLAIVPRSPWHLEATWLDHGRTDRESIRRSLHRARRAFMRWSAPSVAPPSADRV